MHVIPIGNNPLKESLIFEKRGGLYMNKIGKMQNLTFGDRE